MYYSEDKDQVVLAEFLMPFAGKLDPQNRWVRLSSIMPWDKIEEIYLRTMSTETGRKAIPARMAFGTIYITESENLTDEGCVTAIQENPYMQYFLGLHEFQQKRGCGQNLGLIMQRSQDDVYTQSGSARPEIA